MSSFLGMGEALRQELLWLCWYLVMVSVTPLLGLTSPAPMDTS